MVSESSEQIVGQINPHELHADRNEVEETKAVHFQVFIEKASEKVTPGCFQFETRIHRGGMFG